MRRDGRVGGRSDLGHFRGCSSVRGGSRNNSNSEQAKRIAEAAVTTYQGWLYGYTVKEVESDTVTFTR